MGTERTVPKFQDVLEMVESLPPEDQGVLIDIIRQRLVEHRRAEILADIEEARGAYKRGDVRRGGAADVMRECME